MRPATERGGDDQAPLSPVAAVPQWASLLSAELMEVCPLLGPPRGARIWLRARAAAEAGGGLNVLRDERIAARAIRAPRVRLAALVALALAAAFIVWLVTRPGSSRSDPSVEPAVPSSGAGAQVVAIAKLRALATPGHPVYWAGPRAGMRYELTEAAAGRLYVRYLPVHVQAGDPRARFLTIGTYPVQNAYAQVQAASRRPGAVVFHLAGGTIAVYNRTRPTNVYLATPGSPVQVEVYDPDARAARKLVLEEQVARVG